MDVSAPALPIDRVLHPTDLSRASRRAFLHALRIALAARGEITLLHALRETEEGRDWSDFPGVRDTLARWGVLPEAADRRCVARLGLRVEKVQARGRRPLRTLGEYIQAHPPQLVAVATHGRDGVPRWLHRRVAEPLARRAGAMTLFLRHGARGFVEEDTGRVTLRRILVPVAPRPRAQPAVTVAAALARAFEQSPVEFVLCWVGAPGDAPAVEEPAHPGWTWRWLQRRGRLLPALRAVGEELHPDLIVMSTRARRRLAAQLLGSHTERLARRAPCAVLAVPGS